MTENMKLLQDAIMELLINSDGVDNTDELNLWRAFDKVNRDLDERDK